MSKIFLHIGINKTGTSAIQSFFNHYREPLQAQGLLYPRTGWDNTANSHYALSQALGFKFGRCKSAASSTELQGLRRSLDEEIIQSSAKAILFSSEMFVLPGDVRQVRDFLAPDNVFILVYLRRHDTWFQALYSQALKPISRQPNPGPPHWKRAGIEAYIRFQRKHMVGQGYYRHLLDRWATVFGRENIIVRPYESQQNAPDIVVDLLRSVALKMGVDIAQLPYLMDIRSVRRNISLTPRALQLAEVFRRAKLAPEIRERLMQHVLSFPATELRQSLLSPARRLELIEQNAADYEYIAREYMGREDGRLFYDPLPDPNEPWEPPKPLTPREIVEETVAALTASGIKTPDIVA